MSKHKEMYSKAYIQSQLDEMAKKAGINSFQIVGLDEYATKSEYQACIRAAEDNINKMVAHQQNIKHKTTTDEVVHISKKQWCAALQGATNLVASTAINSKNMNENDKASALSFAISCKELARIIWKHNNCNENEPIEMIFEEPDSDE